MDWLKEILKKAGIEEGKLDSVIGDMLQRGSRCKGN